MTISFWSESSITLELRSRGNRMQLYCGRCWHDRGSMVPLTRMVGNHRWPGPRVVGLDGHVTEKVTLLCSFCGEERRDGGTHLRVHEVLDGSGEDTVMRIPHVIAA